MFCRRVGLRNFLSFLFILSFYSLVFPKNYLLRTEKNKHIKLDEELFQTRVAVVNPAEASNEQSFSIYSSNGLEIAVTFFDRKSSTLVVLGQGFGNGKEVGLNTARDLSRYDVVMFDFRWKKMGRFVRKPKTLWSPVKKLVLDEKEEILTVVNHFKSLKKYDQVVGLGECYSAFTFVISQSVEQKKGRVLFDKLILDSCWYSLNGFLDQLILDPWLAVDPQDGGASKFVKKLVRNTGLYFAASAILSKVTPDFCIKKYLSKLKNVPLLFIHGANDKLIPVHKEFDRVWNAASHAHKVAILTPFCHVQNSKKMGSYGWLCEQFIESKNVDEFVSRFAN